MVWCSKRQSIYLSSCHTQRKITRKQREEQWSLHVNGLRAKPESSGYWVKNNKNNIRQRWQRLADLSITIPLDRFVRFQDCKSHVLFRFIHLELRKNFFRSNSAVIGQYQWRNFYLVYFCFVWQGKFFKTAFSVFFFAVCGSCFRRHYIRYTVLHTSDCSTYVRL